MNGNQTSSEVTNNEKKIRVFADVTRAICLEPRSTEVSISINSDHEITFEFRGCKMTIKDSETMEYLSAIFAEQARLKKKCIEANTIVEQLSEETLVETQGVRCDQTTSCTM